MLDADAVRVSSGVGSRHETHADTERYADDLVHPRNLFRRLSCSEPQCSRAGSSGQVSSCLGLGRMDRPGGCENRAPFWKGSSLKGRQAGGVRGDGSAPLWFSSRASSSRWKWIRSVMPLIPAGPLEEMKRGKETRTEAGLFTRP